MSTPRRLTDNPASEVGALLKDASGTPVDPTPQAANRVWSRLQEPSPSTGLTWKVSAAGALAILIAVIVGLRLVSSPDLRVQADHLLANGQPVTNHLSSGDRLTNIAPTILRIDGWGEIALAAESDLQLVDTEPMQFLLHKGTAVLTGRSLRPLTLMASTSRVEVRWANLRIDADGRVEAAEQDGDFSIHGAILPAPRVVTPSTDLKKRQQEHHYTLSDATALAGPAAPKSATNFDRQDPVTKSGADSVGRDEASNSDVNSAAKIEAAKSDAASAEKSHTTKTGGDSAAKSEAAKSDVDSEAKSEAANSDVVSAAKIEAAKSDVDSEAKSEATKSEAAKSDVDSAVKSEAAKSDVDSADRATPRQQQNEGPRAWYVAARSSSNPDEALRLFDRVAETDNPWTELAAHQAIRNLMRRKRWHEASTRLARARTRFASSQLQSELHLDAITCALALGNLKVARAEAQRFVDLFPNHPRVDEMRAHSKK